jgi:hypothetical protein
MRTDYIHKSHNRSHSIKPRLVQKYINAHKFIFIASGYKNVTFFIQTHFSLLQLCSHLTSEVVRQSHWLNLGRGSGKLRTLMRLTKRRAVQKFVYGSTLCKPNHLVTFVQHLAVQNQYSLCLATYPLAKAASCCHVAWQQEKHEL